MFFEEMNALWWVPKKQIKIESVYLLLRHPVQYIKQWRAVTSETGNAIGRMPKAGDAMGILWHG